MADLIIPFSNNCSAASERFIFISVDLSPGLKIAVTSARTGVTEVDLDAGLTISVGTSVA